MHDQPTSSARRFLVCAIGVAVVSVLGSAGCSSSPTKVDYARPFPRELAKGPTLDIQVFREAQHIEFTNTTARAYGPSTLWLNGRFCRPIDGLAVGETQRYRLKEFRDEYQDPFREGGFFATERPDRLVLAQLETAGDDAQPVMLGLIVVGTGDAE